MSDETPDPKPEISRDHLPGDPDALERKARRLRRAHAGRQMLASLDAGRALATSRPGRGGLKIAAARKPRPPSPEDEALLAAHERPSLLHPVLGAAGFLAGLGAAALSPRFATANEAAWRRALADLDAEDAAREAALQPLDVAVSLDEPEPAPAGGEEAPRPLPAEVQSGGETGPEDDDEVDRALGGVLSLGARLILKSSERF